MTFTEGSGRSTTLKQGDTKGTLPKTIARYPQINENDKSFIFNPFDKKHYFMRGTTLMEHNPSSKTTSVVRSPITAVSPGPYGNLIFSSPDNRVSISMLIFLIMLPNIYFSQSI